MAKEPTNEPDEPAESEPIPAVREPETPEPLLSDAELDRIRQEARKKVEDELASLRKTEKKAAMATALDAEVLAQRRALGLADHRDDIVEVLIDVAPFAKDITVDGTVYLHGQWYKMDRRKADSVREIMARSWDSEDRAGNPNRRFRREAGAPMNTMLLERRTADGAFTMGHDPRVHGQTGAVSGIREVA